MLWLCLSPVYKQTVASSLRGVGKSICLITVLTEIYFWLVREKLRIFPFGQYIVENVVFLAFWQHKLSQVQNRNGGWEEMYKNVNTVSDGFSAHASDATARRHYRWRRTLLGRRVCKCVDVYIITLSCTWQIYALFERLLVTSFCTITISIDLLAV